MKFQCPHCAQLLSLADEQVAALPQPAMIDCPTCGGRLMLPVTAPRPQPKKPTLHFSAAPQPAKPKKTAPSPKPRKPKKTRAPLDPAQVRRNILILGCAALVTLGGIAGFLATREAGKTVKIEQKIVNKLIQNEYFQRLIREGKTTEEALAKVEDAYAYGPGFIGVSRAEYTWKESEELARSTASVILDVTVHARQGREELGGWIAQNIPALRNTPVRVKHLSKLALMDAPDLLSLSEERPRRVLLAWPAVEDWPDKGWTWTVKPDFEAVERFDAATGLARARSGGHWGLIDRKGAWVLKPEHESIDRFSARQSAVLHGKDGMQGLVDSAGRIVAPPVYEEVQELIHGFVPVKKDGKWGYLDATGKQVVPPEWEDAWRFNALGYAVVTHDRKRGLIDRSGRVVLPPQWDGMINFSPEGIGAVRQGARDWGLITPHGPLTPVNHELDWQERTLDLGFMRLRGSDGKRTVFDLQGKELASLTGADAVHVVGSPRGPLLKVEWPDGSLSLQDPDGRVLFRTQGKGRLTHFGTDGLAVVEDDRGAALMDALGRLSAPFSKETRPSAKPPGYDNAPPASSRYSQSRGYGSAYGQLPPGWTTKTVKSAFTPESPYWNRYIKSMPYRLQSAPDLLSPSGSIVLSGMNPRHELLEDLVPYAMPPKYGLIDASGRVLAEPAWDEARVLSKDWVLIRVGHRYGLANGQGEVVVEPVWDDIKVPFVSYVSLAADGKTVQLGTEGTRFRAPWIIAYQKDAKTVLLPDGKPALPAKLDHAETQYVDFYGPDRLVIRLKESTGVVNLAIYEPRSGALTRFPEAGSFLWNWTSAAAGMIWMKDAKATTEIWRLMTREGRPLGYTRAEEPWGWGFAEDRAALPTPDGWTFIDPSGRRIGDGTFWQEVRDFREGRAAVKKDGKWGFIDLDGKLVIPAIWQEVRDFHHGRAAALGADTSFWGYLAPDGTLALAALWTEARDFTAWTIDGTGESLSRMQDTHSYYNRRLQKWIHSGEGAWKGQSSDPQRRGTPRSRPVATVQSGTTWVIIGADGLPLIDPVITSSPPAEFLLREAADGQISLVKPGFGPKTRGLIWQDATTAWVLEENGMGWAFCDATGRKLNPTIWNDPPRQGEPDAFSLGGTVARSQEGAEALLAPSGQLLLPPAQERIIWVAPGVAVTWEKTTGGLVNAQGQWLFKDDAKRRIARFGSLNRRGTYDELRHGLIVIEDQPRWGFARLNRP
ncbi:MAG: WG repeat-containing protein [Prosthecobacter sp.]|uniref:WG repeat-containing protein n=1 Tax=Prosthecobacter sp. TaxID=1965333 RepID=UPI0019F556E9|nr:WG repeat-containing protein [Prosthecobacter sp.]MBE2282868.1 WG repeat-containing protein [Prosthecobacter sp.]